MAKRKIIKIDEDRCNGCGLCIPNCPEGAIKVIDKKARLISDLFCDGLGACIGHCPEGAIVIEEREAEKYDEREVMSNIVKQGENVIREHLEHLKAHNQTGYLIEAMAFLKEKGLEARMPCPSDKQGHGFDGCPGSKAIDLGRKNTAAKEPATADKAQSELRQWPVQIMLVPAGASYFQGADILIAADCVGFACPGFHRDLLKGKSLLVGCPKLDDAAFYSEKIAEIVRGNDIKSITYAHMEVPCCYGLIEPIKKAIESSGKKIPFKDVTVSLVGDVQE